MKRIISLFASLLMTFNLYSMSPIDFEDDLYGVEVGYVNKQYVTRFPGGKTLHEDLFGREGSFLHGVQFGAYCQPMLKCGLGLRAGAYWEQYFSSGRPMGYESFTEGNFYLPLNVIFAIPFLTIFEAASTTRLSSPSHKTIVLPAEAAFFSSSFMKFIYISKKN